MLSFELASHLLNAHSLKAKVDELSQFNPKFISLTTHHPHLPQMLEFLGSSPISLMPHVRCANNDQTQIKASLQIYQKLGIKQLLIIRGDIKNPNELTDFHFASQLIEFIKQEFQDSFELATAAYPENSSDFIFLQEKIKKGASKIITQYCYDLNIIEAFQEQCKNFKLPIHIGLMPPPQHLPRLEALAQNHNISIPSWLKKAYQENGVDEAFSNFIQKLQKLNYKLHLFNINSFDAAKISRLLKVRPRV